MTPLKHTAPTPLTDQDLARLETLLDAMPAPLQPLDVSALDGFLCGVLLQPQRPAPAAWLPLVTDMDGQPAPDSPALKELQALVMRRFQELDLAIGERQWFDPWIFDLDDEAAPADAVASADAADQPASPSESLLPWVAGFAAAMEHFPHLMAMTDPALVEPLALLFMHFDPEDLEDADELLAVIETLEPPEDLGEAVQDAVKALMLIADVSRPRVAAPPKNRSHVRSGARTDARSNARKGPPPRGSFKR